MPRLIDADELLEQLQWLEVDAPVFHDVWETICSQPTVDAVSVVRCKDCEYYSKGMPDEPTICELTMCGANDEGFCAWAERREDAKTD